MGNKTNIRSIRFSDELAELIDRQAGRTFTEKFENLITRCVWELPQKEAELKRIRQQIDRETARLQKLRKIIRQLDDLALTIEAAKHQVEAAAHRAEDIAKG